MKKTKNFTETTTTETCLLYLDQRKLASSLSWIVSEKINPDKGIIQSCKSEKNLIKKPKKTAKISSTDKEQEKLFLNTASQAMAIQTKCPDSRVENGVCEAKPSW